jgi:hypothetical protein
MKRSMTPVVVSLELALIVVGVACASRAMGMLSNGDKITDVDPNLWREVPSPTTDRLDTDHRLTIVGGVNGNVDVAQEQTVFVEFPDYQERYHWLDDGEDNSSACGSSFKAVRIYRYGGKDRRFDQNFYARK